MSSGRLRTVVALVGVPIGLVFLWLAVRNADLDAVWGSLREADAGLVALAIAAFGIVYAFQSARWRRIAATPAVGLAALLRDDGERRRREQRAPGPHRRLPPRPLARARSPHAGREGVRNGDPRPRVRPRRPRRACSSSGSPQSRAPSGSSSSRPRESVVVAGVRGVLLFSRTYIEPRDRERRERGLRPAARPRHRGTPRRAARTAAPRSCGSGSASARGRRGRSRRCSLRVRSTSSSRSTDALFVTAVLNLGSAVPSSPGYVGTYEWLGVASLGLLGIAHEQALAFTILLHAAWYVPTTLVGGCGRGVRRLRRSGARGSAARRRSDNSR